MAQAAQKSAKKSTAWIWLVVVGPVLTIIGIIIGSFKTGSLCGSVFKPDNLAAELYDSMGGVGGAADCRRSIASAAVPTWILIVLGVALVLTAIIVRSISNSRPPSAVPQAPSVASQIEDLARLREQELISPEEFEAKRAELLSRL